MNKNKNKKINFKSIENIKFNLNMKDDVISDIKDKIN